MKRAVRLLLLVSLFFLPSLTSFAEEPDMSSDDIFGTPPPASVHNWERLSILGARHHSFLVIWISPQSFLRRGLERLLVLSDEEYRSVADITRSLTCLKSIRVRPDEHLLLITEHSQSGESQCTLSHTRSCKFLTTISAMREMRTSKYYKESLHIFSSDADCSVPK